MAPLAVYPADRGDRLPEALVASPLNIGRPGPRLGASINGASHDKRHRRRCCYLAHKVRLHWCHQHHVGGIGVRGHHGHFGVANRPSSGNVRFLLDCYRSTPNSGRGKHPRRRSQIDPGCSLSCPFSRCLGNVVRPRHRGFEEGSRLSRMAGGGRRCGPAAQDSAARLADDEAEVLRAKPRIWFSRSRSTLTDWARAFRTARSS